MISYSWQPAHVINDGSEEKVILVGNVRNAEDEKVIMEAVEIFLAEEGAVDDFSPEQFKLHKEENLNFWTYKNDGEEYRGTHRSMFALCPEERKKGGTRQCSNKEEE